MEVRYCDICGSKTNYSYSVIFASGSGIDVDETFDLCPICWRGTQKLFRDQKKLDKQIVSKS